MSSRKTAIVFATLFISFIATTQAEVATSPSLQGADSSTTSGLRIQLDAAGRRVQPSSTGEGVSMPMPPQPGNSAQRLPVASPGAPQTIIQGDPAPAAPAPQVLKTGAGTAKVVRLNGLFRAGSRASIGPDGKLQGDCHIDSEGKGAHK